MASSSSAKKVARVAAKSGSGPKTKKQANWLFPAAIVAIVAIGAGIVFYASDKYGGSQANTERPRAQLSASEPFDHWHAAFAINVCGEELAPQNDATELDPLGIHTHGDGLVHIHPFATRSAGKGATMQRFFDQVGLTVTDDGFKIGEGDDAIVRKAGTTKCGGKDTELTLVHWKDAEQAATGQPDEVYTKDFGSIRYTEDLGAYTLALEPKGTVVPPPSSAAQIVELGSRDGAPGQTVPEDGATEDTTPTDESTPTTAASSDETPTTAASSDTTAAGSGE